MPRFSILIPTRERPATLQYALESAIAQSFDDYEIVVADNCGDERTANVVRAAGSAKVRHLRSDVVLSMSDNWERGLAACQGEYVTVIGDDDALLPDALQIAHQFLNQVDTEVFSWTAHKYWWPDCLKESVRNRLHVYIDRDHRRCHSRAILDSFLIAAKSYSVLPSIYNAFVRRDLIDRIVSTWGRYFLDPIPDVASGIINVYATESYIQCGRSLSIAGSSGRSIGTAQVIRSKGDDVLRDFFAAEGLSKGELSHKQFVRSDNIVLIVRSCAQRMCALLDDYRDLKFNPAQVVQQMADVLNTDPEGYATTLLELSALAEKYGVDLAKIEIPPPLDAKLIEGQGPFYASDKSVLFISVNGDQAGFANVAAAARIAQSMMPLPS